MKTHSHKSVLIDLFNLPPLPDERNTEESYMDVPNNYYIPDGKNSRLLDRTDRVEFNRETLDGTGFQLKILYLEHAFGTKYFIMDCVTGSMMGIYDDKVEQIDLKGQLNPFNINQLDRVMHILGQRRLGLDRSSIPTDDIPEESLTSHSSNRMEYPSTPKQFNLFQEYKKMWSTAATCLQQTKELKYTKIGSRSLLKWPSHFTFFPGVFSSTRRWQTSILLVKINTSTISNRLCGTSISSCRRIS